MKISFTRWLATKSKDQDRVGDLARDAVIDESWPTRGKSISTFYDHLENMNASQNALDTLKIAWYRFEKEKDK